MALRWSGHMTGGLGHVKGYTGRPLLTFGRSGVIWSGDLGARCPPDIEEFPGTLPAILTRGVYIVTMSMTSWVSCRTAAAAHVMIYYVCGGMRQTQEILVSYNGAKTCRSYRAMVGSVWTSYRLCLEMLLPTGIVAFPSWSRSPTIRSFLPVFASCFEPHFVSRDQRRPQYLAVRLVIVWNNALVALCWICPNSALRQPFPRIKSLVRVHAVAIDTPASLNWRQRGLFFRHRQTLVTISHGAHRGSCPYTLEPRGAQHQQISLPPFPRVAACFPLVQRDKHPWPMHRGINSWTI